MSEISRLWNNLDIEHRKKVLNLYFSTKATIVKHSPKLWCDLPHGFKREISRLSIQNFRNEVLQ